MANVVVVRNGQEASAIASLLCANSAVRRDRGDCVAIDRAHLTAGYPAVRSVVPNQPHLAKLPVAMRVFTPCAANGVPLVATQKALYRPLIRSTRWNPRRAADVSRPAMGDGVLLESSWHLADIPQVSSPFAAIGTWSSAYRDHKSLETCVLCSTMHALLACTKPTSNCPS